MFFTKEVRKAVKENTKDIKDLDAVLCKNLKLIDDLIPRINMLELHVKSLLSKNEDMSVKVYELHRDVLSLLISESDEEEEKEEEKPKNNEHKYGTKKDGTPAKKRGRKNSSNSTHEQQYLTYRDVINITTLGKSTIYKWRKQNKFPNPIKLSWKKSVWLKDDVDKWMEKSNHNLTKQIKNMVRK